MLRRIDRETDREIPAPYRSFSRSLCHPCFSASLPLQNRFPMSETSPAGAPERHVPTWPLQSVCRLVKKTRGKWKHNLLVGQPIPYLVAACRSLNLFESLQALARLNFGSGTSRKSKRTWLLPIHGHSSYAVVRRFYLHCKKHALLPLQFCRPQSEFRIEKVL